MRKQQHKASHMVPFQNIAETYVIWMACVIVIFLTSSQPEKHFPIDSRPSKDSFLNVGGYGMKKFKPAL